LESVGAANIALEPKPLQCWVEIAGFGVETHHHWVDSLMLRGVQMKWTFLDLLNG
jgi:hypothetical protein